MGLTKEQELSMLLSHIAAILSENPTAECTERSRVRSCQFLAEYRPVSLDLLERSLIGLDLWENEFGNRHCIVSMQFGNN